MEPNSRTEQLVSSYSETAENYLKAIEQLEERFGHNDLQIYVGELLTFVM